jgi:hypothetical protein
MSDVFKCWTVSCKTNGCMVAGEPTVLFLDIIGPKDRTRRAIVPPFDSFTVTCEECKAENQFFPGDLEERNLVESPRDYRCGEFLKAVHDARERREEVTYDVRRRLTRK